MAAFYQGRPVTSAAVRFGGPLHSCSYGYLCLSQAALLLELWDSAKPRFDPESVGRQARPQLPVLPDVEPLDIRSMREQDKRADQQ